MRRYFVRQGGLAPVQKTPKQQPLPPTPSRLPPTTPTALNYTWRKEDPSLTHPAPVVFEDQGPLQERHPIPYGASPLASSQDSGPEIKPRVDCSIEGYSMVSCIQPPKRVPGPSIGKLSEWWLQNPATGWKSWKPKRKITTNY